MVNKVVTSRLNNKFAELKSANKKALLTYITAGDPSLGVTKELVLSMEQAGADVVELGVPYSDPLADGPVIQKAAARALQGGTDISSILQLVTDLRKETSIPLVFLMYYNPILQYGFQQFLADCNQAGVDGLIIPDLPLEERRELNNKLQESGYPIDLIPLVAPTSARRVKAIVNDGGGFVYCISSLGVTGMRKTFAKDLTTFLNEVKQETHLPTAIGFGISDEQAVYNLKDYADGLIVGSAIIKIIEEYIDDKRLVNKVADFVSRLKKALNHS